MASCLLFTPRLEEGKLLFQALHNRAAYLTDQAIDCEMFLDAQEAVTRLRARQMEAIIWDVSQDKALPLLPEARRCSQTAFLLIIASADTSPLTFLRPEIAPSSLILRPLGPAEVDRVACEILHSICGDCKGSFVNVGIFRGSKSFILKAGGKNCMHVLEAKKSALPAHWKICRIPCRSIFSAAIEALS